MPKRFSVQIGARNPTCWLAVGYRLKLDDAGRYLTVDSSVFAVYAKDNDALCLCHFDYDRDNVTDYPDAHLQILGESLALAACERARTRELERLHFPVGGRRYRPILEDVLDFLIAEDLAVCRPGGAGVIKAERIAWQRIQLRAAVRRDPDTALGMLAELGLLSQPSGSSASSSRGRKGSRR